ncbi:hypothetical protein A2W67_01255 [Candidatus Nomurabacteria bacterium RIFCSPLOWO2_02_40_28]|uniref:Fimbrial assembly family protein n=2 Tax=Candidatus Nomuraibacteriota TaxID=1752729 RepID=A0A837HW74_9BACT|nr:MAG: hypothetical protein UT27_C0001G0075 [Candidatus Nomurabacteria bacterium GW2011_GWD2_39_12]KKR20658.1 MAG: hypothetical protein UT51_C0002G0093 [Candidatus Nomurabacteria bacterium GW2011_GWC2_39_41]KKR37413.1 MAG: hypothetical protein UT70_C0001G0089 [Candidatus Nomurabacteria bacterium GW2011_GWE2_40_10]KKR38661.1 MAG: hypothetical protein UT73_C0002G0146 [Candidatus Nomurabacteria bacterium GW2011_GWB1_40_11]KKR40386.1 MAG: hypothetical protein UT74_C0001G0120 [Parcubacteria group b
MINLIPNKEKKEMTRSFYFRLVVLFLVMLAVSAFIAFVAILPSYFLSSIKYNLISTKLEIQKKEVIATPDQKTLLAVKDLNTKLDLVENAEKNKFNISEKVINAIVSDKMPSIKITKIFYESDPEQGKKISIQGSAPSREVLLSFRRALEADSAFKKVDLPISNFVKGSNIQFSLSFMPS